MAKLSWCTVSPMSGSKNGSIAISASTHTGRSNRSTNVTVTNANGTHPTATIAVSQAGAAVSSTIDATKPDIPKTGGTIVVNGTSNSQKLRLIVAMANAGLFVPMTNGLTGTISINGAIAVPLVKETNANPMWSVFEVYVPSGDPGASAKYNYVLNLVFGASPFAVDAKYIIRIVDSRFSGYDTAPLPTSSDLLKLAPPTGAVDCTTKLLAGLSTISARPASLSLVNAGTVQNVTITSNDDWTVS